MNSEASVIVSVMVVILASGIDVVICSGLPLNLTSIMNLFKVSDIIISAKILEE